MDVKIDIAYEDEDVLVINKPAGISVTKDRAGDDDLLKVLKARFANDALCLVHRLDKGTSGVMVVAKTTDAQRTYSGYFAKRQVSKTYLALVSGVFVDHEGVVRHPLARSRKDPLLMVIDPRGKEAETKWKLLADFGMAALIAANPVTGRTHQIRVHMTRIGMPLLIDPLYGGTKPVMLSDFKRKYRVRPGKTELPLMERMTLHAYQLCLPGKEPDDQNRYFNAPLDKKFCGTIKMLAKHNPVGLNSFTDLSHYEAIVNGSPLNLF